MGFEQVVVETESFLEHFFSSIYWIELGLWAWIGDGRYGFVKFVDGAL